jgi:hypothetical protein
MVPGSVVEREDSSRSARHTASPPCCAEGVVDDGMDVDQKEEQRGKLKVID